MKKILGGICLLAIFAGMTVVPGAFAAVIVHDPQNTAENHATYLQTAQNTVNTATQIANQVTNLASMSPETMLAHIFGVEEEVAKITDTVREAQGLMNSVQTAQKAWDSAFKQVDTFFEGKTTRLESLADNQRMVYALDKTYRDSLKMAKTTSDIEQKVKHLREMMKENQNATGNKQAIQTQNNLVAQQIMIGIEQNQTLGALTSAVVGHLAKQNQAEAHALAVSQECIKECDEIIANAASKRKQSGLE